MTEPEPGPCLELFMEYIAETGERSIPHLHSAKLVAVVASFDEAEDEATQHAAENFGDGDYHVKNAAGRRIAGITVRAGFAVLTPETPGPTAAEELAAMERPCAFCAARMILIPCQSCGCRRCAYCVGRRVCCPPPA